MDLGIRGRWAILAGSSRGLGRACAESIAREGVNVVINGRTQEDVDVAVAELTSHYGVEARGVVGDSATSSVQDALMAACSEPDIVLLNGQGPSPKGFLDIEIDDWDSAVRQALTGPLALVQRVVPGMKERNFGRIVAVSSAMVKSPNSLMSLSHGTRLGLTGVLKGLSKDLAKYNVTVNHNKLLQSKQGDLVVQTNLVMRLRFSVQHKPDISVVKICNLMVAVMKECSNDNDNSSYE